MEKLALQRRHIDGRQFSFLVGLERGFKMLVRRSQHAAQVLVDRGPQWLSGFFLRHYFSRATTKSGTHSRARLNSESASGAKAWRLCSA